MTGNSVFTRFRQYAAAWGHYKFQLIETGAMPVLLWTFALSLATLAGQLGFGPLAYVAIGGWVAMMTPFAVFQLRDLVDLANFALTGEPVVRRIPPGDALDRLDEATPRAFRILGYLLSRSSPSALLGFWATRELAYHGGLQVVEDESLRAQAEQMAMPFADQVEERRGSFRRRLQSHLRRLQEDYREEIAEGLALQGR